MPAAIVYGKMLTTNLLFFAILLRYNVDAALGDYLTGIRNYFGYNEEPTEGMLEFGQRIPYEVSTVDEKFISEAVKLTGVEISELDSCQHRVILKLKSDCDKLNDEQLAKVAVHLLNCQSYVEGRTMYPCTEDMSIKDCTTNMDADTWTSYHLMSNRARAVCYTIRQSQFRGLAEHTVNRLMEASKDQLKSLHQINMNQENLRNVAQNTYETLTKAHDELSEQQKDMQKAQFQGQLMLENNIYRLLDEKRLIHETHEKLVAMTKEVQNKLETSAKLLEDQSSESKVNHKELLDDLMSIHDRTAELFEKLGDYSAIFLKQNEEFKKQYQSTLQNLQEVNRTVHNLVGLVGGTRQALEDRLSWIMTALGGTDTAVERLYLILWHVAFILVAMLSCAFLSANTSSRWIVATLPPLNLAVGLYKREYLDPVALTVVIVLFVGAYTTVMSAFYWRHKIAGAISWKKTKPTLTSGTPQNQTLQTETTFYEYNNTVYNNTVSPTYESTEEADHYNDSFPSLTPPRSRNGTYSIRSRSRSNTPTPSVLSMENKHTCLAKTRAGTACKLTALAGRSFCYRHQRGDSVMGS